MFVFAEKNLSYQISSFNESTGFGLLKASPVEFVKYPFVKGVKLIISFILNKLQYLERKLVTSALAGFHAGPLSWSSWNLEILLFMEGEKLVNPKKCDP